MLLIDTFMYHAFSVASEQQLSRYHPCSPSRIWILLLCVWVWIARGHVAAAGPAPPPTSI